MVNQSGQELNAIWPAHEAFYIDSMLFISSSAVASIDQVAEALTAVVRGDVAPDALDQDAILDVLQHVLIQGAALSRYFWPARRGHEARAKYLRSALAVTDTSALRSRGLRNAIEHFDERLDVYLSGHVVGHILPHYVGRTPSQDAGVPLHLFRAYFVDRGVFSLLGEQYEMQPMVDEIGRIDDLLVACAEAGGRLQTT